MDFFIAVFIAAMGTNHKSLFESRITDYALKYWFLTRITNHRWKMIRDSNHESSRKIICDSNHKLRIITSSHRNKKQQKIPRKNISENSGFICRKWFVQMIRHFRPWFESQITNRMLKNWFVIRIRTHYSFQKNWLKFYSRESNTGSHKNSATLNLSEF